MDNRPIDRLRAPIEYQVRAVRAGVIATLLIVALLGPYPYLPGVDGVRVGPFYAVLAFALAGVAVVSSLPWARLFETGRGDAFRYAWSVLDIVLITVALDATGGPSSPLFGLYFLTTLYFAASYPLPGQLALLGFTFVSFATLVPGSGVEFGVVWIRLGTLGVVEFLGSFLSLELMREMREHARSRAESDRRAELLATLASAASRVNVLEPAGVLRGVIDGVGQLGFEAADLCVIDSDAGEYRIVESRGLPYEYTAQRHRLDRGLIAQVLAERRTVVAPDYGSMPHPIRRLRDDGFRTVVGVPVWVQGRLAAVLEGGTRGRDELRAEEIEALELLALQAGRALENANRFEREQEAVERLGELDRMKSEFISMASHELRTPLTVILGVSSALATAPGRVDEAGMADLLERLHANARSLDQLVNSLLDFSRLERGAEIMATEFDMGDMAGDLASRLSPLFEHHVFTSVLDDDAWVVADPLLMERAVENLLGNAAKHTPAGTTVSLRVERVGDDVVVAVCDDGPGIADADRPRLGERFFRGGGVGMSGTRGLGLGLAMVREVLEAHGAELEVESEEGAGATFRFRLPAFDWVRDATAASSEA